MKKHGNWRNSPGVRWASYLVISETPVADVFGGVREFAFAMAAESGPSTSISVGEDEVTVTVHGVFELR